MPKGKSKKQGKVLGVKKCGLGNGVDMTDKDDGSGRQRWKVTQVGDKKYTLKIVRGRPKCGRVFLSTDEKKNNVNLDFADDGTGLA